jgi:DNA-binding LytR/AlgR family response regulator
MKALIIEDEILSARNLIDILKEIGDIEIVDCLESIAKSVDWFKNNPAPDMVFMDIHLADGSAFEIFNRVSINCPVIFTTAYDEYALKAFKVNSIDYLLKPVDYGSLFNAIQKYKTLTYHGNITRELTGLINAFHKQSDYQVSFLIPGKGDKLIPVLTDNISCIYIENGITRLVENNSTTYYLDSTLDEIMVKLNPDRFFRANRQFIIARDAVKDIDLWFNKRIAVNLKVKTPERIILSRARTSEFKAWFIRH